MSITVVGIGNNQDPIVTMGFFNLVLFVGRKSFFKFNLKKELKVQFPLATIKLELFIS